MDSVTSILIPHEELSPVSMLDVGWQIETYSPWSNQSDDPELYWVDLPGRNPYPKFKAVCGSVFSVRQCESEDHHSKVVFRSCHMYDCPVCWNSWKSNAAYRVSEKIFQAQVLKRDYYVYHWVISPDPQKFDISDFARMEKSIKKHFQIKDSDGFTLIFHAYRARCLLCGLSDEQCHCKDDIEFDQVKNFVFSYSPHWHIVTNVVFISKIQQIFEAEHYVLRKIATISINDLFKLYSYELGHCSRLPRRHAIRYWGAWAYNKMHTQTIVKVEKPVKCHKCESKVIEYDFIDVDPENLSDFDEILISNPHEAMNHRLVKLYSTIFYLKGALKRFIFDEIKGKTEVADFVADIIAAILGVEQFQYQCENLNIPLTQH